MKRQNRDRGIGKRNLVTRLLGPVNLVSFLPLMILVLTMLYGTYQSLVSAIDSKAESAAVFLAEMGRMQNAEKNSPVLSAMIEIVLKDKDYAYISFHDNEGKVVAEKGLISAKDSTKHRIEKPITNAQGNNSGKVIVVLNPQRLQGAMTKVALIGILGLIVTQIFLSLAVYFVTNNVIRPLQASFQKLSDTAQVLGSTSSDISKFSEALSSGVNQQAEVVQQTTAAMAEMSSMLSQTSGYAKQSETVMSTVTHRANYGMNIMNQMVEAMTAVQQANNQLSQMSEIIAEIGNKTTVINDIVFKTQLLSFNAAIEAARAGVHGKGFAVVAEEVGSLAKLSGTAAQDIASLLQDSERQVEEIVKNTSDRVQVGKQVTEQALKNFKEIANDINLISSHFENISSASREQELGVTQTNQAMTELNKTAELNNQIANRASETSRILSSEVQSLDSIAKSLEESLTGSKATAVLKTPLLKSLKISKSKMSIVKKESKTPPTSASSEAPTTESPSQETESDFNTVADKIVEMAKKQRRDRTSRKQNIG